MDTDRPRPAAEGTDVEQTLVGIAFSDTFRAQEFLTAITRLAANDRLHLKDAVFVTKDEHGHTVVRETTDLQPGRTAVSSAWLAGFLGLIVGGPIGLVAGAAIGAGAGAVTAKLVDLGISDDWVEWFRQAVEPGKTIVALLVEHLDRDALADELTRFVHSHLVYANLSDEWVQRLRTALGEGDAPIAAPSDAAAPPATD